MLIALTFAAHAEVEPALTTAVLAAHRDAVALERALQHPHTQGLSMRVGSAKPDLLLRRVRVQIDDGPVHEYEYSAEESAVLRAHGLHPLTTIALDAGQHRLRAELVARRVDARPDTARILVRIDERFDKSEAPLTLELELADGGWREDAVLRMRIADPAVGVDRVGRFVEAVQGALAAALLEIPAAPAGADPAPAAAAGGAGSSLLARYNRAAELMRQGETGPGLALLAEIGTADAGTAVELALRDHANLVLGYALLRERRGADAVPAFQRVRSPGPYGNPALLGLGWAYLLPTGPEARAAAQRDDGDPGAWSPAEADTPSLRRRMPFRYAWSVAAGEREADLREALVPWNELNGRDPLDPAVQEGMLAVAYALGHLGAHAQAERYWQRAVERLHTARAQLDDAYAQLGDGRLLAAIDADSAHGWRRRLADLPYDDATAYFRVLAEDAAFLDALEDRHALRALQASVELHLQRLQDLAAAAGAADLRQRLVALQARVATAAERQREQLLAVAAQALLARQRHTDAYLGEAVFALARIHDPSPLAQQRLAASAAP
ncbi:MAG: hypothetical protein ACLGI7_11030 [Gammaproteobacteria bacterium]